ncbi:hypothetical protein K2173_018312 [Erythroxylum novogranatense]|uniref:J domain-containing protein n=1 Tax=Erythroxylum novogranatense TaxID=1862640 RepID=A0AAV8UCQ8_9ROSI|nr:hypothetical protein K2173_018312 [Erythroxylum novogranatense]
MAPQRGGPSNSASFSSGSFGSTRRSSSNPVFDDHNRAGAAAGDDFLFDDVFGGPPKYSESRGAARIRSVTGTTTSSSIPAFDYDSIFKDQNAKSSSLPVIDKPVYDDDIFGGLPGIKNASSGGTSSAKYDDVFASIGTAASPKHKSLNSSSPFDDLIDTFSPTMFLDAWNCFLFVQLLVFISDITLHRLGSDPTQSQMPCSNSAKTATTVMEDPFVVLESTPTPSASSSGFLTDLLEEINRFSSSVDNSSNKRGVFDEIDHLDNLGKYVPPISPENTRRRKDRSPLRSEQRIGSTYSTSSKEPFVNPVENAEGKSFKKSTEDLQEHHESVFDMSTSYSFRKSTIQTVSHPSYVNASYNETITSPRPEEVSESSDDVWLTLPEITLFTQPTIAPPPSRPPPPWPPRVSKSGTSSFSSANLRKKVDDNGFSSSSSLYAQSPTGRSSVAPQIDELEVFATGRIRNNNNEHPDTLSGEDVDSNSSAASAAAMKEAVDKAQVKFRQMRETDLKAGRNKEAIQLERDMYDAQQREFRERQERAERERQNREREEEHREQRRLEKEREKAHVEIKRWAAGKEGNLRALLSTMQYVLWPECGWQPVSLTDLITAAAVKKAYRKATLCIHPDKVQQKGANIQQKYIAEKVFDLLKEAWNKFNSEELF